MNELIISSAEKADAKEILEYLNIVGGESDNLLFGANGLAHVSVEDEEKTIESIKNSSTSRMFVGKINGEIACIGNVTSSPRKRIAHHAEIAISVKQKFWHHGVGSKLMKTMIDFCKENGVTKSIYLGVRVGNDNAVKMYEKFGFQKVGIHKDFFCIDGKYYDEILMDLHL